MDRNVAAPRPSRDISAPQTLEHHRKANSSQSSAQHKPGLGAPRGLRKSGSADQSVLPALEETAVAGAHHTLLSGGFHASRREAGGLAKQPCLLGYVLCLIPEVLIMTGDLRLCPHPTGLARPVPDPGWWKGPESSSQPLPAHQAKPQSTSEDIQSHVQGELELVTGQFPDLTAQSSCVNLPLGVKAQASTRPGACAAPRITPAPDADGPTECSTHLSFAAWNVRTRRHRGCEPRGEKQGPACWGPTAGA